MDNLHPRYREAQALRVISSKIFPLDGVLSAEQLEEAKDFVEHFRRIPASRLSDAFEIIYNSAGASLSEIRADISRRGLCSLVPVSHFDKLKLDLEHAEKSREQAQKEYEDWMEKAIALRIRLNVLQQEQNDEHARTSEHRLSLEDAIANCQAQLKTLVSCFHAYVITQTKEHKAVIENLRSSREARRNEVEKRSEAAVQRAQKEITDQIEQLQLQITEEDKHWTAAYYAAASTPRIPETESSNDTPSTHSYDAPTLYNSFTAASPSAGVIVFAVVLFDDLANIKCSVSAPMGSPLPLLRERLNLNQEDRFVLPSLDPISLAKEKKMTVDEYAAQSTSMKLIIRPRDTGRIWITPPPPPAASGFNSLSLNTQLHQNAPDHVESSPYASPPLFVAPSNLCVHIIHVAVGGVTGDEVRTSRHIGDVFVSADATLERLRTVVRSSALQVPTDWRFLDGNAPIAPGKEKTTPVRSILIQDETDTNTVWIKEKN